MDTQQTPTTEPTTAPQAPAISDGADALDARASALLEQIQADQKSAARDAQAPETPAEPAKPGAVQAAAADEAKPAEAALTTEPKTPEQLAEERRQRIEQRKQQLAEEERARVAASHARKAERQQQVPETQAQAPRDTLAITDAASFFAAAEKLQIPPNELAAWLTQQQDPAKAAEAAARKTLSPVEQKLKEIEERQAALERREAELREQAQLQQIVEQNYKLLASHLESVKSDAPLSAAFATNSPAEYRRAVESICDALPQGFTAQDVIDQLEENLSTLAKALQIQAAVTAPSTAKPTPKPAAAKANVGNRLAAERATTVDPSDDDEGGDLEERARKLKALLSAG